MFLALIEGNQREGRGGQGWAARVQQIEKEWDDYIYVFNVLQTYNYKYKTKAMSSRRQFQDDSLFGNISEVHNNLDDPHFSYGHSDLKPSDEPTRFQKVPSLVDFLHSSSLQLGPRNYQISFEETFMGEHEKAFQIQLKNFIESSFKSGRNQDITFQSSHIFGDDLEFGSLRNEDDLLVNFENKNNFLAEVFKEEKLQDYFTLIFETVPKNVASEMLFVSSVAYFAWEAKLKDSLSFGTELEIVSQAKRLAESLLQKLYKDQRIKFLNLREVDREELNSESATKKAFKAMIEFLFATTGLIASGFFSNPYTESEEFKRARSFRLEEDEDEISSSSTDNLMGLPRKRLH